MGDDMTHEGVEDETMPGATPAEDEETGEQKEEGMGNPGDEKDEMGSDHTA